MKKIIGIAALLVLTLSFIPAHAGSQTVYYVAGGGTNNNVPHPPALGSTVPQVGIGGFGFGPHKYTKIHLADSVASNGIEINVSVPEGGLTSTYCTNAAGDVVLPVSFPTGTLFVTVNAVGTACDGVATAGTLTVSF